MSHIDQLVQVTKDYLDSQNWHYQTEQPNENTFIFNMNMSMKNKLSSCRLIVAVNNNTIQSLAICPLKATEDVYGPVVEYLTRANYGLMIGKFEFDYKDGEIRYQSALSCVENVPSMADVERVVDVSFLMMRRYGDGLMKNLMGIGFPEQDVKEAEGRA